MNTMQFGAAVLSATLCFGLDLRAADVERLFRAERYSRGDTNVRVQQPIDEASWVWRDGCDQWGGAVFSQTRTDPETLARMPQTFLRFRRDFTATAEPLELDVSADERFILLLDGREIARGPMRGLPDRWHYQSYRITGLGEGPHRIEAVCWQVGEHAPLAQLSVRGGFIVKAYGGYDGQLTTGQATWRVAPLSNTRMTDKGSSRAFGVGSQCEVTGTSLEDEEPPADAWQDAAVVRGPVKTWAGLTVQGWKLFPTPLKDMMHAFKTPGSVKSGFDVLKPGAVVPAGTTVTAWWDLGNYYCAYPEMTVSGGKGATVRWDWAECLTGPDGKKGDRAAFEGLDITRPFGDVFRPDGRAGAHFTTPWWRCGKWCRITIETADEPLTLQKVELAETRYPVEMAASFECDDPFVMKMQPACARALQMCMHEMFFDCPYYEQQMYPGDSRVQYLVSGLFDTEDRMVRNAITLYDTDRRENGMIPMNCPTRGMQDALGFTCCEAMMFGDYAWNHTNLEWLKARLPGLNHTLMGMETFLNGDGLLGKTPGWNFVDWVPSWSGGVPPDGDSESPNAEMNLQYLHAIISAAITEEAVGDATLAAHWRARAERLKAAIRAAFWCEDRALFASDAAKTKFSEHSQCLALLADVVSGADAERCFKALVETPDLARGTIYYKHYLFSTFFKFRRPDLFFKNLGFWKDCLDWNLSTILETPEVNSRSDCHGWGSHPLWHLHTGVAGVRSAAPFYEKVLVEPQPAHLRSISCSTPTPKGDVKTELSFDGGKAAGAITLPDGLSGVFRWGGKDTPLAPGRNLVGLDWLERAAFISPAGAAPKGAAAVFEKRFANPGQVRRATWDVTGQGVFEAFANGRRVGDDFLKPGVTESGKCRHVYSYDVTGMLDLRGGAANVLAATVTPGWWCDQMMRAENGAVREWQLGKEVAFRGELRLELADGSVQTVGTDESWLAAYSGPVVSAGIYEGEVYDARREAEGLAPARRNTEFAGELRPASAKVLLREDLTLAPCEMHVVRGAEGASEDAFGRAKVVRSYRDGDDVRLEPGEMLVMDFAQNCSAVPSFEVSGEAGAELEIRHSEMLNESNGEKSRGNDGPAGTPYLASLRSAYAGIRYTLKDGEQSYMPRYTYFGYRHVGVTATKPVVFRRWRSTPVTSVSKDMEVGRIVTGDARVNRLVSNIRWGMLSNYLSSPTDCPQRDERLGWTADTQVFMNSAAYLVDTRDFLGKFLVDLRDAQRRNGCYMCFVPNVRHAFAPWASAGWTDAGVIMPYRMWKWYGDRRFVDDAWDSMVRYMDFLESDKEPYRINHGDWLAFEHHIRLESDLSGDAMDPRQVKALNAYFRVWMAMLMREMAEATGRGEAAAHYADEETKLRGAFAVEYMGADGTIKDEYKGQCNDLYMIKLGLCGGADALAATKRDLIENIRAHGDRLQTGFLGTAILLPTLTFDAGAPELAYSLLLQDAFPGWLYSVDQGATTIWERWNGYTKDRGFGPVGMNSFNHYAYGCVLEWLFSAAAGIRQERGAAGWSRFMLAPVPDRRLGSVEAEYRSPAGLIKSAWRYEGEKLVWEFSVPDGATALVLAPGASEPVPHGAGSYRIVAANVN